MYQIRYHLIKGTHVMLGRKKVISAGVLRNLTDTQEECFNSMIDIQPQQTLIKLPLTVPPLRTPHFEVGKLESKVTPEPVYTIINFNNFEFEKYLMCELASINI